MLKLAFGLLTGGWGFLKLIPMWVWVALAACVALFFYGVHERGIGEANGIAQEHKQTVLEHQKAVAAEQSLEKVRAFAAELATKYVLARDSTDLLLKQKEDERVEKFTALQAEAKKLDGRGTPVPAGFISLLNRAIGPGSGANSSAPAKPLYDASKSPAVADADKRRNVGRARGLVPGSDPAAPSVR